MSLDYEEYIAYKPQTFKLLNNDQFELAKEHARILQALGEKGDMSVKEIHDLYTTTKGKHTKTLKTIYRYMEILEEADIVQVAGYRKYANRRTTEKLYTRTAKIFFNKSNENKKEWLNTVEGNK